jgi:hypothetical protein
MISPQEIVEKAETLQPQLLEWLFERLGHLPPLDAMLVIEHLLSHGAKAARKQMVKATGANN